MRLLISFIYLFTFSSFGTILDESVPHKETNCKIDTYKSQFLLRFDKKNTNLASEYSGAPLVYLNSQQTHTIESDPNNGNDFNFSNPKNNKYCSGTLAFALAKNILAIIYTKNNRPFQDQYHVVVWDAKTDKIMHKQELGAVGKTFAITHGFAFSTVAVRSDISQLETISPSGKKMLAGDEDLNAVQTFTLDGKKIKVAIDPDRSFRDSEWKKFFKNKTDYLKSIGWNPESKTVKNNVVYKATYFNRRESDISETCINLTDAREGKFENETWRCIQEKN